MLKLTIAVVGIALAGTASAAGWKSLKVDGSSEAAFEQSLSEFKDKLSTARRHVFGEALNDIWIQGAKAAETEQREYTATDYYRQLDGLGYEQVVTLTDPTGATARERYRAASLSARASQRTKRPILPTDTWGANDGAYPREVRGTPTTTVCPGGANGCQ